MQEDICETIYSSLEQCCPALYLERAPVSVLDLRAGVPTTRLHIYQPRTIILAQLAGVSTVSRPGSEQAEQLSDLIAYGCDEVTNKMICMQRSQSWVCLALHWHVSQTSSLVYSLRGSRHKEGR